MDYIYFTMYATTRHFYLQFRWNTIYIGIFEAWISIKWCVPDCIKHNVTTMSCLPQSHNFVSESSLQQQSVLNSKRCTPTYGDHRTCMAVWVLVVFHYSKPSAETIGIWKENLKENTRPKQWKRHMANKN